MIRAVSLISGASRAPSAAAGVVPGERSQALEADVHVQGAKGGRPGRPGPHEDITTGVTWKWMAQTVVQTW